MADIMGSGGLAWYEWKKHGRCTGLTADRYFAQSRTAYEALSLPRPAGGTATAELLEAGFLAANPGLAPDDVIVTC
jgi:ribonuclease T2